MRVRRASRVVVGLAVGLLVGLVVGFGCNGRVLFDENGCDQDSECPLSGLYCDARSRTCVMCTADTHCAVLGTGLNRCDLALHRCVQCGLDADCGTGRTCHASRCVTPCEYEGYPDICPSATPHCEASLGFCILCEDDNNACASATASGPICNMPTGLCVSCLKDANCGGTNPRCDTVVGRCVECLSSVDCDSVAKPVCNPLTWSCVARP
jgi:hypothetical protein